MAFFKCLAQQKLAAFWRGDVAIGYPKTMLLAAKESAGDKETEVAFYQAALVVGQTIGVLPQGDVTRHVHLLWHPVVGTCGEVLFPSPLVFKRHQLIDVGFWH